MTGWQPTDKGGFFMNVCPNDLVILDNENEIIKNFVSETSCRKCGAHLCAYWDNGVISHYRFVAPLEGCCCEVEDANIT